MEFLIYCGLAVVGALTAGVVAAIVTAVALSIRGAWRNRG